MLNYHIDQLRPIISKFQKVAEVPSQDICRQKLHQYLGRDKFLTITDIATQRFSYIKNLDTVLGYDPTIFQHDLLIARIAPKDLFLTMEFATIAFSLLTDPHLSFNEQYAYQVTFNIQDQTGRWRKLERNASIYSYDNGLPAQLLDVWTDLSQRGNTSPYVSYAFFTPNPAKELKYIYQRFHQQWMARLTLSLKEKELYILHQLNQGKCTKDISTTLFPDGTLLGAATIERYKRNVIDKLNSLIVNTKQGNIKATDHAQQKLLDHIGSEEKVAGSTGLLEFAGRYNLFRRDWQLNPLYTYSSVDIPPIQEP